MRTGRPTKLTPALQAQIVLALQSGAYVEAAAAFAGINKDTFYAWMKKGARQQRGKFRAFSDAIKKAHADAALRALTVVNKAANAGHWQAAAWYLERSDPKHWGRRVVVEKQRERKPKAPKVIGFNPPVPPTSTNGSPTPAPSPSPSPVSVIGGG